MYIHKNPYTWMQHKSNAYSKLHIKSFTHVITSLTVYDNFLLNRTRLLFSVSSSVRIPLNSCTVVHYTLHPQLHQKSSRMHNSMLF